MNEADKLRKLAGIDKNAPSPITGEIGTDKGEYMRKNNIRPGTDEWFKLWFARPKLTGENPTPKK
jgi:hypothetical protein